MKRNAESENRGAEGRGADVESGEGVSLPSGGRSWRGCAPSPEFFFDFLSGNGAFWALVLTLV